MNIIPFLSYPYFLLTLGSKDQMEWKGQESLNNRGKLFVARIAVVFAALVLATPQTYTVQTLSHRAVWNPPIDFVAKMHQDCRNPGVPGLGPCFVAEMQRLGASQNAVAFAHRLKDEGYLRDLQMTGKVDVAYVSYPFRANENEGCLLVNGTPAIVDVDTLNSLPQSGMRRDPAYISLLARYPRLSIWPGDRSGKVDPVVVEIRPDLTQRFIVHYRLRDNCHACLQLGAATFGFDFDGDGRFLGAKYIGIRRAE